MTMVSTVTTNRTVGAPMPVWGQTAPYTRGAGTLHSAWFAAQETNAVLPTSAMLRPLAMTPGATAGLPSVQAVGQTPSVASLPMEAHNPVKALKWVKLAMEGLGGGAIYAFILDIPLALAFGAQAAGALLETHLAKRIYEARSPWAARCLELSHRLMGGSPKPAAQLTAEEKRDCLTPITVGVSLVAPLALAGFRYANRGAMSQHQSANTWLKRVRSAKGSGKFLAGLRYVGSLIREVKPMQAFLRLIEKRPALLFPMALVSGLTWGLAEAQMLKKLAKNDPNNRYLGF